MTTHDHVEDYAERARRRLSLVAGDERLAGVDLVIEHRVIDGDDLVARYHLRFGGGALTVVDGAAEAPDVLLSCDAATATALRNGESHAHRAFLTGRLRIDGDIDLLLAHGDLLAGLLDTMAATGA